MDIFGQALLDFQKGNYTEDIKTLSSLEEEDWLPIPYLFRKFKEMPQIEKKALTMCRGKILDVGCGAGSHSLYLQNKGFDVVGLDQSKGAIDVCHNRGIHALVNTEFLNYIEDRFDTVLLLMNGLGIAGKIENLGVFLNHAKRLLKPNGQILVDSSDIIYMFENDEDGGYWVPGDLDYYGEVKFQMEYKKQKGPIFDWLYVDFTTLTKYADQVNLHCELIVEGDHYDYLAKLVLK